MVRIQKIETQTIHDLATLLELECSSIVCAKLARALGYQLTGRPGRVELEKAGMCTAYYSVDTLAQALLREARRLVGRQ